MVMKRKDAVQSPYLAVVEQLKATGHEDASAHVPKKWEKVGHVLILHSLHTDPNVEQIVAAAFLSVLSDVDIVLSDDSGVKGELRQPTARVIARRPDGQKAQCLEVQHVENGVRFTWDVLQIMFSSGNTKERIRFRQEVCAKDEVVVDMFAGLGYFSIPLAMASADRRPRRIRCIEKNPASFQYLQRNIRANAVEGIIDAVCGDNREMSDDLVGCADRVLMGYLPTPIEFLPRAFCFLRGGGGIIHYHFTATKAEAAAIPLAHVTEQLEPHGVITVPPPPGAEAKTPWSSTCTLQHLVRIKSYRPQVYHWVAELRFTPSDLNHQPTDEP